MTRALADHDPQALRDGLAPRPEALQRDEALRIAAEVCAFYRRIKRPDAELPEPYRAGGEWAVYVEARSSFYQALLDDRVEDVADTLTAFWRNDLGPIVSQYAYFADLEGGDEAKVGRFTTLLRRDYESWRALFGLDASALEVPDVGQPWGLVLDGTLVTPLALRFHTHSRQIAELLRDRPDPVVLEIGGGYAGMAHRLAAIEPRVRYVDVDLPETLVIAAFHLLAVMPDRDVRLWDPAGGVDASAVGRCDVLLAPHYALAEIAPDSADLVLNAFSLSEMRAATVDEYVARLQRITRRYFLQNNVDRFGVVNRGHERIPCSRFPIDPDVMKTVYWRFDTFQGPDGDYRESLHERIDR